MSFVMIAAGPSSSSPVRTLPLKALLLAGGVAALGLLVTGASLGFWVSQRVAPAPALPGARPFMVEQLGALSGRLFKLESQAGQLSLRLGLLNGAAKGGEKGGEKGEEKGEAARPATPAVHLQAAPADSGGPLLPPRHQAEGMEALQTRLSSLEQLIAGAADAASLQNLTLMHLPTRPPLGTAELVSVFGNRDDPFTGRRAFHAGLDFVAVTGTAIHAAGGGTVAFAGLKPDYGQVVEIDHGNGLVTRYAHASALWVRAGDLVAPGDAIAAVGSSGRSTGAHLHFEVLRHGEAVNPRRYLAGL
jgi:murein DD-endopeptidase MepM/ murein hydrolase activator NlpD